MRSKLSRRKTAGRNAVIKWILYSLIIIFSFLYLTMPINTVKPLVLIPAALCISMYEGVAAGCGAGILCGLLLDVACGKTLGFNALLLLVFCMFASLFFMYLMRTNVINIWALSVVCILLQSLFDLFFFYAIWGIHNTGAVFMDFFFPQIVINSLVTPLYYLIFKAVYKKFGPSTERYIEEKNENITRE